MIEIENLNYRIRDNIILKDVNLKILPGDFWLIFGPNGAGKTTLFKIISGLILNYEGDIRIASRNIRGESRKDLAKKIAYLPQFDEFSLPLPVREILLSGRYPYTSLFKDYTGRDHNLVSQAADQFGLKPFLDRDINTLSGGERKKVMLASAFIQDVSIILLDEPFTFLDPRSSANLKAILSDLNRRGKTLVIISHHIEALYPLVNKTAALKAGKLVFSGNQQFDPAILKETYGICYNQTTAGSRKIIYIDE
jgi:iron complex transport system ATP-binding protein